MDKKQTETIKRRYNRISNIFDVMEMMMPEKWRKELLEKAYGDVLEIGTGTGSNLKYYPKDVSITGIDFSPKMLQKARQKVDKQAQPIHLVEMNAEQLEFPDNTFDTVVSTCVFCSVPHPIQGLKEIRRVTKPDGQILMLEHMQSDNKFVGKSMDILNPIGLNLVGANINRQTMENIAKAHLKVMHEKRLMGSIMRQLILSPNKKQEVPD